MDGFPDSKVFVTLMWAIMACTNCLPRIYHTWLPPPTRNSRRGENPLPHTSLFRGTVDCKPLPSKSPRTRQKITKSYCRPRIHLRSTDLNPFLASSTSSASSNTFLEHTSSVASQKDSRHADKSAGCQHPDRSVAPCLGQPEVVLGLLPRLRSSPIRPAAYPVGQSQHSSKAHSSAVKSTKSKMNLWFMRICILHRLSVKILQRAQTEAYTPTIFRFSYHTPRNI